MSINQSNQFWHGAFTNSSLEIFDEVPVLETIISSCTQVLFPSISQNISICFERHSYSCENKCSLIVNKIFSPRGNAIAFARQDLRLESRSDLAFLLHLKKIDEK